MTRYFVDNFVFNRWRQMVGRDGWDHLWMGFLFFGFFSAVGLSVSVAVASSSSSGFFGLFDVSWSSGSTTFKLSNAHFCPSACEMLALAVEMFASITAVSENSALIWSWRHDHTWVESIYWALNSGNIKYNSLILWAYFHSPYIHVCKIHATRTIYNVLKYTVLF